MRTPETLSPSQRPYLSPQTLRVSLQMPQTRRWTQLSSHVKEEKQTVQLGDALERDPWSMAGEARHFPMDSCLLSLRLNRMNESDTAPTQDSTLNCTIHLTLITFTPQI